MTAMGQISKPASRIKEAKVFMVEGKIDNRPRSPHGKLNSRQQDQPNRSEPKDHHDYLTLRSSSKSLSKRRGTNFQDSDYRIPKERQGRSIRVRRSDEKFEGSIYVY
ncbi:hypothetical protein DFH28DRAFT_973896 [Melampsora americana]|nr:hypothetical protein DFH28DRAFT_973896 [Melampsora americana]